MFFSVFEIEEFESNYYIYFSTHLDVPRRRIDLKWNIFATDQAISDLRVRWRSIPIRRERLKNKSSGANVLVDLFEVGWRIEDRFVIVHIYDGDLDVDERGERWNHFEPTFHAEDVARFHLVIK